MELNFKTDYEKQLIEKAKLKNKIIVLPEAGYSESVFTAGINAVKFGVCDVIFLVKSDTDLNQFGFNFESFKKELKSLKVSKTLKIININKSEELPNLVECLVEKRKDKGMTELIAKQTLENEIYFATMLVETSIANGLVCGAVNTTANSIRPALQVIKSKQKGGIISSFFIMVSQNKSFGDNGVFVLADCAINENPTELELEQIVNDTVISARELTDILPKVSLLSYSTLGSANGEVVVKMRNVANSIKSKSPNFAIEGEMQLDASIVKSVGIKKAPNSAVQGDANILIFPDLQSGNISYKIMQRLAGFTAIGPICQGFRLPVNDVSRGASSDEILLTIAITCLQES